MDDLTEAAGHADLTELLARIARGDADAFGRFYDATCRQAHLLALARASRRGLGRVASEAVAARETRQRYLLAWRLAALHPSSGLSPLAWLLSLDEPAPLPAPARAQVACA